jgi:hypothetical protein
MVANVCACSPAFNWRDVRPADTALQVLLPCKPEVAERTVPLAGHEVVLHMLSCEAGGLTFAVSALRKPADIEATAVVQSWRQASLLSLKAQPDNLRDWVPELSGTQPRVQGWQAVGVRHDGTPVQAHVLALAQGDEVYQVAVYGPATAEVLTALVEGIRVAASI